MKKIILCDNKQNIDYVYGDRLGDCPTYTLAEARESADVRDAEAIFSTWGMPRVEEAEIRRIFPALRAVFYAAGSVQGFAEPFINRGVRVFSAWQANGVPVAEYTLGQILLSSKGTFRLMGMKRAEAKDFAGHYPGMYDIRVGLLGLGAVGGAVAERLKGFDCQVLAYDPYASDERFARLGARRAEISEIFAKCEIVSNHLANLQSTIGIITREYLFSMRDYATFINTGRGPQLSETDLCDMLASRPTVTALLDVLTDEAHSDESPLAQLPNCFITPHIAGSMGNEVHRMSAYMLDEFDRWKSGEALRYEVSRAMLDTMA